MKKISKITAMILISLLMTTTILGCEYLPNFHSHKYQARYDESGHYKICNCGDIIDREEHILDWVIDIEAENDLAGRKHKECACGYTKYVDTQTKKEIVKDTVNYVEQVFKDIHGAEKLEKAKEKALEWLNEKGIKISETELEILIESAVNGLKGA